MSASNTPPGAGPPVPPENGEDHPDDEQFENGDFNEDEFGDEDVEASLNDALSDLERMLERHEDGGKAEATAASPGPDPEPFNIPLLDEVVIPGPGIGEIAAGTLLGAEIDPGLDVLDEAARRRKLATRLASEIEVIVQDRLEEAMERARKEIQEQVRNHMDIILPEIVEEILQHRLRDDG